MIADAFTNKLHKFRRRQQKLRSPASHFVCTPSPGKIFLGDPAPDLNSKPIPNTIYPNPKPKLKPTP